MAGDSYDGHFQNLWVRGKTHGGHYDVDESHDRYVLKDYFHKRPALNSVLNTGFSDADAQAAANTAIRLAEKVANEHFEVVGSGATTASVTFDHDYPGITLTTGTSDNHTTTITPHLDADHTGWSLAGMWDTHRSVHFVTSITIGPTITTYSIHAGLKLTLDPAFMTDDDQIYFVSCTDDDLGILTSNGNLHVVHSIGGTEYISDLGITLAANTTYNLKIAIDSDRKATVYVNGTQYSLTSATTSGGVYTGVGTTASAALTDNIALIPYIGVRCHIGSQARALILHYLKMSRNWTTS